MGAGSAKDRFSGYSSSLGSVPLVLRAAWLVELVVAAVQAEEAVAALIARQCHDRLGWLVLFVLQEEVPSQVPSASLALVEAVARERWGSLVLAAHFEPYVIEELAAAGRRLVGGEREGAVLPRLAVACRREVVP